MPGFDVFLYCLCGHKRHLELDEHPSYWPGKRFVCTQCGAKGPKVDVYARWIRAFKGDPQTRL